MGVGYSFGRDTTIDSVAVSNAVAAAWFVYGQDYGSTYANASGGACNITTRRFAQCDFGGVVTGSQNFVVIAFGDDLPSSATRGTGANDVHRIEGRFWKTYDKTIGTINECTNKQVFVCIGRPTGSEFQVGPNMVQLFERGKIVRFDDGSCRMRVQRLNDTLIQEFSICSPFV